MSGSGTGRRAPLLLVGLGLLVVLGLAAYLLASGGEPPAQTNATVTPRRVATGAISTDPSGSVVCSGDEALPYLRDFNAQMPELKTRAKAIPGDQSKENFELQMLRTMQLREKVVANTVPECMEGVQQSFLAAIDAVIEGYDLLSDADVGNDAQGQQALVKASDQLDDLERELDAISIEE